MVTVVNADGASMDSDCFSNNIRCIRNMIRGVPIQCLARAAAHHCCCVRSAYVNASSTLCIFHDLGSTASQLTSQSRQF
jgi:hypothetical protein